MYVPCTAREEVQHVEMLKFGYGRVPFRPSPLRLYDDDTSDRHQPTPAHRHTYLGVVLQKYTVFSCEVLTCKFILNLKWRDDHPHFVVFGVDILSLYLYCACKM